MAQSEQCKLDSVQPGLLVSNKRRAAGGCDLKFAFNGKSAPLVAWSTGKKSHNWCGLQANKTYGIPTHAKSKKPCFADVPVREYDAKKSTKPASKPSTSIGIDLGISNTNTNKAEATAQGRGGGGYPGPHRYPYAYPPGFVVPGIVPVSGPTFILPPEKYVVPVPGDTFVINPAQPAQPYASDNLLGLPPPPPAPTAAVTDAPTKAPAPVVVLTEAPTSEPDDEEPAFIEVPQIVQVPQVPASPQVQPARRSSTKLIIIALIVCLLVGAGIYYWRRRSKPNVPRVRTVFL